MRTPVNVSNISLLRCSSYSPPPYGSGPLGSSCRLICFNVGAFEDDPVLTCCWQSKKINTSINKIKEADREVEKKA